MRAVVRERPAAARIALALGIVYVVWGSTYLAIRVAVETMPPLLMAGIRFVTAGAILYAIVMRRTALEDRPTPVQWRSATIVGGALLLGGNGLVVLAEDLGVPSGIAALLVGTVPLWMTLIGRIAYKERVPPIGLAGIAVGFAGVALLAQPSGDVPVIGPVMLIGATLAWSAGSLYSRRAPLPRSPFLATAMEMLAGGALQIVVGLAIGEAADVHPSRFSTSSVVAFVYLTVVGSLAGYTAYIYALSNARTALVSTYAYVNPVIAVALGALFANERIGARELVAGTIIVGSVALIVAARPDSPEASPADAPSSTEDALRPPPDREPI